jgi:hypothetical protein
MQQHDESREAWIRRHTWGATAMNQDEQPETPPEDDQAASRAPGEMDDQQEDEAPPAGTSLPPPPLSPGPRIVEGTLVESTLLVALPPPSAQVASDSPPVHTLLRWLGHVSVSVLVALLTMLALTLTQAPLMRRFVALMPAAGATATVTLVTDQVVLAHAYSVLAVPAGVTVSTTQHQQPSPAAQVEARLLAVPTLPQKVTVPTTATGHQPATQAHGLVTFYNQAPTGQTIPSGMLLNGADGVQVVTDQAVVVPAAHLPDQGQASVAAHALPTGPQGNIGADDLDGLCCFAGIAVQNTRAFVGGQNARDFRAVGARDVNGAATPLIATLTNQGQAAVQAQVRTNEQLVPLMHPVQCAIQVTATPAIGAEATQVTVTVQVTCRAEVYRADQVQAQVTDLLSREASTRLGSAYLLLGEVTPTVSTITTINARQAVVSLHIQAEGVWAYHLSAEHLHQLIALVAGTALQVARATLLRTQGIHQVSITSSDWWDDAGQQPLPTDPNRIQVIVLSWAGM